MLKKALIAAATLATLMLGASAANAGYSIAIGYDDGWGGGYHHHHHWSVCFTKTRPIVIRVWSDYADAFVYRSVYRPYQVCF